MGKIHTKIQAECLIHLLNKTVSDKATLIGSFGKGAETSEHDIDVLIPDRKKTSRFKTALILLLEPKPSTRSDGTFAENGVTDTDWGGWYFHNTFYGDVDIFFTTKDFDY